MMPPNAQNIGTTASNAVSDAHVIAGTNDDTINFNTSAIDHTQSEVAKTFHWREFGNGNANGGTTGTYADASMYNDVDSIAYVMDDGLTSLSGDLNVHNSGYGISVDANSKYFYVTFIGTGISWNTGGAANNPYATWAQNLPYGTHILKFANDGSNTWDGNVYLDGVDIKNDFASGSNREFYKWSAKNDITFHQPKKPPIPEDACVIADYMLMADYVANTSGSLSNISKGVRMISSSRDVYYDATSTSDFAYNHTADLGSRNRGPRVRWGNIGSGGTDGPIIAYFGHPKVDYHIGTSTDGSERYHLKLTNSSGTLETTNVSGTTSSGSISNHEITGVSTSNGSAYFSSSKSDGVLGANKGELIAYPDDATYDWLYFGDAYVATPIHTSHHYQSFETPFLHELVGGDRNMEQTNLVVSSDGKTWDEVTRDTSYISNSVLTAKLSADFTSESTLIFDDFRGVISKQDLGNKDFAIAYDRFICLRDGGYNFDWTFANHSNGSSAYSRISLNGTYVYISSVDPEGSGRGNMSNSVNLQLKRGDYIQFLASVNIEGTDQFRHTFSVTRI